MRFSKILAGILASLVCYGGGAGGQAASVKGVPMSRPLGVLVGKRVLVLPVQRASFQDSLRWKEQMGSVKQYLATIDEEIAFALKERGIGEKWILPSEIAASAKRNGALAVDPYAIAVEQLRAGAKPDKWQLRDPLAAQVRSLIALNDARYVVIPVELSVANGKVAGEGEPRLRVVVIDARRAQLQWEGEIVGAARAKLSPAVAADLGSRLGELIGP